MEGEDDKYAMNYEQKSTAIPEVELFAANDGLFSTQWLGICNSTEDTDQTAQAVVQSALVTPVTKGEGRVGSMDPPRHNRQTEEQSAIAIQLAQNEGPESAAMAQMALAYPGFAQTQVESTNRANLIMLSEPPVWTRGRDTLLTKGSEVLPDPPAWTPWSWLSGSKDERLGAAIP